jgi:HEAT repeat protein
MLRSLGPKAAKVMPAIKEASIKDENANVRLNCMLAVAFGSDDGPKYLAQRFPDEKDANVRTNLYNSLIYSNNTKQALPLVKPGMKDSSPQVRQAIVNSLYQLGRDSKEGFEAFEIGIKDADASVRAQAAYTANLFGSKAWPPLEGALKGTKDSGFRQAILQGMMNTQYRSKSSVGLLSDCLKDQNPQVRFFACNLLGSIGPDADNALPQLRELTKDSQPFVQNAARTAITQIEKKKQ